MSFTGSPKLANGKYCIADAGSGKYRIFLSSNNNGACAVAYGDKEMDEGILAFDIKDPLNPVLADLSTTLTNPYLVLYDCAYGECRQTYGYVENNGKIYQVSPSGTVDITNYARSEEAALCESNSDVGKVRYTPASGRKRAAARFEVCIMKSIDMDATTGLGTIVPEWKEISSTSKDYYIIKPDASPYSGKFAGDLSYYNIGLLKTQPHLVAKSMLSPQLPVCTDTTNCKLGNGSVIGTGEFCIDSSSETIYKKGLTCEKVYGKDGTATAATGIKIFQKTGNYNKYIEPDLSGVTVNDNEIQPFFVIYDCSSELCSQTSGFIKYKIDGEDEQKFINCYTQTDIKTDDNPEEISSVIGCIPLLQDGKSTPSCTGPDNDITANDFIRATYGMYNYDSVEDIFNMCSNIKEPTPNYKTQYISMKIGETGQFLFVNGYTPFPNTKTDGNVFVKIGTNYATLARSNY